MELLRELERRNPGAKVIYAILDNARYTWSKEVYEYVKDSRIRLIHLPSYSPNLNLIERLWQYLHEEVLYNRYYEKFAAFKEACLGLLAGIERHKQALKKRLRENFRIVGNPACLRAAPACADLPAPSEARQRLCWKSRVNFSEEGMRFEHSVEDGK